MARIILDVPKKAIDAAKILKPRAFKKTLVQWLKDGYEVASRQGRSSAGALGQESGESQERFDRGEDEYVPPTGFGQDTLKMPPRNTGVRVPVR